MGWICSEIADRETVQLATHLLERRETVMQDSSFSGMVRGYIASLLYVTSVINAKMSLAVGDP